MRACRDAPSARVIPGSSLIAVPMIEASSVQAGLPSCSPRDPSGRPHRSGRRRDPLSEARRILRVPEGGPGEDELERPLRIPPPHLGTAAARRADERPVVTRTGERCRWCDRDPHDAGRREDGGRSGRVPRRRPRSGSRGRRALRRAGGHERLRPGPQVGNGHPGARRRVRASRAPWFAGDRVVARDPGWRHAGARPGASPGPEPGVAGARVVRLRVDRRTCRHRVDAVRPRPRAGRSGRSDGWPGRSGSRSRTGCSASSSTWPNGSAVTWKGGAGSRFRSRRTCSPI